MALTGGKEGYTQDGRVVHEEFAGEVRATAMIMNGGFAKLAVIYKQIDASVGQFALATLAASTQAIESGSAPDDSRYVSLENQLISLNSQRNALAAQMIALLEGAEFNGQAITQQQAQPLVAQGQALLAQANALIS